MAGGNRYIVPEGALNGDRISDTIATALQEMAQWVETQPELEMDEALRARLDPALLRALSQAVVENPRADPVRVLERQFVEPLVSPESAQRFSVAGIAAELLRAGAALASPAGRVETWTRAGQSRKWESVALYAQMSPAGRLDQEFGELYPFLAEVVAVQNNEPDRTPPSRHAERMFDEDPAYHAVVERVFELVNGDTLSRFPKEAQQAWARNFSGVWIENRGPPRLKLTNEQVEQLRFAVETPRQSWVMAPLLPGRWTELSVGDAAAVMQRVAEVERVGDREVPITLAYHCDRVRTRPLRCFGGALLVEIQGYATDDGEPGLISLVMATDSVAVADGQSAVLHGLCDRYGAQLETEEARLDYLHLFTNWVRGDEGRFQLVEEPQQLVARRRDPVWTPQAMQGHLRPVQSAGQDDEGRWLYDATVAYAEALFRARFALAANGMIEMVDDDPLEEGLPLWPETLRGPLLVRSMPPPTVNPYLVQH
jgi:hypothetical protein